MNGDTFEEIAEQRAAETQIPQAEAAVLPQTGVENVGVL
jgi:hypothetical protein